MEYFFFILSLFTIIFTILSVFQTHAIYSLFYFFLSIITTASIFFLFSSYFIGSLQIIIYAGAILVLFVFVMMMFDNYELIESVNCWKFISTFFIYLIILFFSFIICMVHMLFFLQNKYINLTTVYLKSLGLNLFGPYILVTEFSSILLLSALVIIFIVSKNQRFLKSSITTINHQDL
ncbi:NADH-quinone oxidoreductase subunit J [Buchnera aphidicola]|uniref:NADH-quinone oxidoreductase subunit J n=1 Tax=Buchnera aphidicola TaxID=9 RepID=UPI0034643A17